jgi:hypothetical protein
VEVPGPGCWRLWVRLRSLLRPRRGLEVGAFLPSGEVTETEGDGRVSNIDCDESTLVATVGRLKVREKVLFLMFPRKSQPQANRVTLQAAGSKVARTTLFQTGGVFGTKTPRTWHRVLVCPGYVAVRSATILTDFVRASSIL